MSQLDLNKLNELPKVDRVLALAETNAQLAKRMRVGDRTISRYRADAEAYNLWNFAQNLSEDLRINVLHAGPGTLWTDLEKAGLSDLGGGQILQAPKK